MDRNTPRKAYVCGTDFDWEIGEAPDVAVYDSIETLKKKRTCWKQCGIVELEIKVSKVIEPSKKWSANETDSDSEE